MTRKVVSRQVVSRKVVSNTQSIVIFQRMFLHLFTYGPTQTHTSGFRHQSTEHAQINCLTTANQKRERERATDYNKKRSGQGSSRRTGWPVLTLIKRRTMGSLGNSRTQRLAFLRLNFIQVQNVLFREKERYVNTLKISDCQAFGPIRTVGF